MWLISSFLFLATLPLYQAAFSPTCIGATYSYDIKDNSNTTIFSVSFNLDVDLDITNSTYPNKFMLSNQSYWSADTLLYYLKKPIQFYQFTTLLSNCTINETCVFNGPNDYGSFKIDIMANNRSYPTFEYFLFSTFNGNIFATESSKLFNPHNYQCYHGSPEIYFSFDGIKSGNGTLCCNTFLYYEIPDSNDNPCTQMQTSAKIIDPKGLTLNTFEALHNLTSTSFDTDVTNFIDNVELSSYYGYGISSLYNSSFYCWGDSHQITSNCSFAFPSNDFQFEMFILAGDRRYDNVIIGELIRRNGMWFKYDNISYTPTDPCWSTSATLITDYISYQGGRVESQFCCTAFKKGSSIVYPTPLPTTTIKPSFCNFSNVLFVGEMSKAITTQQKRDFYTVAIHLAKKYLNKKMAILTYGAVLNQPLTFQSYTDFVNTVDSMIDDLPNPNSDKVYLGPVFQTLLNTVELDSTYQGTKILMMGELESITDPAAAIKLSKQIQNTNAFITVLDYSTGVVSSTIWDQISNGRIINGTGADPSSIMDALGNNGWKYCG